MSKIEKYQDWEFSELKQVLLAHVEQSDLSSEIKNLDWELDYLEKEQIDTTEERIKNVYRVFKDQEDDLVKDVTQETINFFEFVNREYTQYIESSKAEVQEEIRQKKKQLEVFKGKAKKLDIAQEKKLTDWLHRLFLQKRQLYNLRYRNQQQYQLSPAKVVKIYQKHGVRLQSKRFKWSDWFKYLQVLRANYKSFTKGYRQDLSILEKLEEEIKNELVAEIGKLKRENNA